MMLHCPSWDQARTVVTAIALSAAFTMGCGGDSTSNNGGSGGSSSDNQGGSGGAGARDTGGSGGQGGAGAGEGGAGAGTGGGGQGGDNPAGGNGGSMAGGAGGNGGGPSGGNGGTGGSGNGGGPSGGNGGAGGAGGGSGGVGGGVDEATAEALCNELCVLGSCTGALCVQSPSFGIGLGETTNFATARACFQGGGQFEMEFKGIEGDCYIMWYKSISADGPMPVDAGTVTVDNPTLGTLDLTQNQCDIHQLPVDGAFSPGEQINFEISGGADVPPLSVTLTAPEDIAVSAGPMKKGEPYTVSWFPPTPPDRLEVQVAPGETVIVCQAKLPGQLTIPATLTALLGPDPGNVNVRAYRYSLFKTDFGGAGPQTFVSAMTTGTLTTPYTP